MKILLALNSFKGSGLSYDLNHALKKGLKRFIPAAQISVFPICDGGDGSLHSLHHHCGWQKVNVPAFDAMGQPIRAYYLWDKKHQSAYVELAAASGLAILQKTKSNIFKANTLGTGYLVKNAIEKGASRVVLMIGGSATNDAGIGILHALGVRFLSGAGKVLDPIPSNISKISRIEDSYLSGLSAVEFEIWTDVANPFTGARGAVAVYSAQKGASPSDQVVLEKSMLHFEELIRLKYNIKLNSIKGTGAAGGVAAGLKPILGATIKQGTGEIFKLTHFETQVASHDLIITGEGKLDAQSAYGKLIDGVIKMAQKYHKPVIGVCGSLDLSEKDIKAIGFQSVFSIVPGPVSLAQSMQSTSKYLQHLGFRIGGMLTLWPH